MGANDGWEKREGGGPAGWAVTETREASLETSTGTPRAGRKGEYRIAQFLPNKATKLLKTLGSVPRTDRTKPVLGGTDRQTETRSKLPFGGKNWLMKGTSKDHGETPRKFRNKATVLLTTKDIPASVLETNPTECCKSGR